LTSFDLSGTHIHTYSGESILSAERLRFSRGGLIIAPAAGCKPLVELNR